MNTTTDCWLCGKEMERERWWKHILCLACARQAQKKKHKIHQKLHRTHRVVLRFGTNNRAIYNLNADLIG